MLLEFLTSNSPAFDFSRINVRLILINIIVVIIKVIRYILGLASLVN